MTNLDAFISSETNRLLFMGETVCRRELMDICIDKVLVNPEFCKAYGSSDIHHAYEGGLLAHTSEVVNYAMHMCGMMGGDQEITFVSALLHDWMKIKEYMLVNGKNEKTIYRRLVRHPTTMPGLFRSWAEGNVPENVIIKMEHCLAAHHGRQEWGSPVEPNLVEAFCVHFGDVFSWRFGPRRDSLSQKFLPDASDDVFNLSPDVRFK